MSEILTDYERRVWKESAEDILAHMEKHYYQKVTISTLAENRLRYEATLQAKDDAILERDIDVAECNLKLGMAKTFLAQSLAREEAKGAQIAALVEACRKFSGLHGYTPAEEANAAWVDPQDWAEFDEAWKEATDE